MKTPTILIGTVARILLIWNLGAECLMETLRPLGISKIKPVIWTMTSTGDEGVKSYYGRFQGPPDLKVHYAGNINGTFIQVSDREFEANYIGSFSKYSYHVLSLRSESAHEILALRLETPFSGNITQTEFIPTRCKVGIKRSKNGELTKYLGFVRNCGTKKGSEINSFFTFAVNMFDASKYVNESSSSDNWPENSATAIVNDGKIAKDGVILFFLDFIVSKKSNREYSQIADVYWSNDVR